MIGDVEEALGRNKVEGVKIEGKKLKILVYADDLIILAKEKEEMR